MMSKKVDRQVIIAWNSNAEFVKKVEETFQNDIILKIEIQLTHEERVDKINQIYSPIHVPHNSARCNYKEPLTLFVVQMEPKYKYFLRTEGYLLCNSTILEFKTKYRKQFHFELFHCSDSIEEAKKALSVFNLDGYANNHLNGYTTSCYIVPVDFLYHIRHIADQSIQINKLRDCVSAQHLIGYSVDELDSKYNLLIVDGYHVVNEKTLDYFSKIIDFNQEHPFCQIMAYKHSDNQYVIVDGKHRSALLHFRGDRHIFVRGATPPCSSKEIDQYTNHTTVVSHLDNFHRVIYSLHNSNIRFVVIRGFKTMPKTADTDLDIVIHPDDYQKFLEEMQKHLSNGTLLFNVEKPYSHGAESVWYRAYRTTGIYNNFLSNKGYQLDTYGTVFFFGPQDQAVILTKEFIDYLFSNKQKFHNLYIPNALSEMILLFCRTYIDLGGSWKLKHRNRFDELRHKFNIDKEQFFNKLKVSLDQNYSQLFSQVDSLFE